MKASLRLKVVFVTFGIMLVSALLSSIVLLILLDNNQKSESQQAQKKIIENIIYLSKESNMENGKIAKVTATEEYAVEVMNSKDKPAYLAKDLSSGEYTTYLNDTEADHNIIVLRQENSLFKITQIRNRNLHYMIAGVILTGFSLILVIGMIVAGAASKAVIAPIMEVVMATKKVAGGDFGVRITEKKNREYKELAENFNTMVDELNSIETLRNDFVSNISHEFKTPIASIQGFAQLLKSDNIDEESRKEYLDTIISESQRLSSLSSNILLLSKLENHNIALQKQEFDLSEQIRRAILVLEPQWSAKNIEPDIDLDEITLIGNEELLFQVWLNIIQNAIKFTPENGTICICAKQNSNVTRIEIKDNGVGMDSQTAKHIFEKFYQSDHSRNQEGNGLGLSLAKKIVELSGGTIVVSSEVNKGTTFIITI